MDTVAAQAQHFQDHFFFMRCGPYGFYCDCHTANSSIEDEIIHTEEPRKRRVLKRKPSQHAYTLGESLSKHSPTTESEGVVDALRRGTSKLNVLEATIAQLEEADEENAGQLLGVDEVEEVQAFKVAVGAGRYLSAAVELHRLEAAGLEKHHLEFLLEPVIVERVRRIDDKYHYSLGMFDKHVEDLEIHEINKAQKLEWGIEFKKGVMRSILRIEEPDLDIIKAFAGMQERDMHKEFNKGLVDILTLGNPSPHDSFWRTFSYSSTTKTENDTVATINGVDALDEHDHSLWGAMYTLAETTAAVNGLSIPPVKAGHVRSEYAFHAWKLSPLRRCQDSAKGFHMSHFIEVKLPAVARHVIEWIPNSVIKGLFRSKVLQFPVGFREFVQQSAALNDRLKDSPRAEFYKELRQRIASAREKDMKEPILSPTA